MYTWSSIRGEGQKNDIKVFQTVKIKEISYSFSDWLGEGEVKLMAVLFFYDCEASLFEE